MNPLFDIAMKRRDVCQYPHEATNTEDAIKKKIIYII